MTTENRSAILYLAVEVGIVVCVDKGSLSLGPFLSPCLLLPWDVSISQAPGALWAVLSSCEVETLVTMLQRCDMDPKH